MQGDRKYHFNDEIFDNIDNPDKAYWMGFLYADASISKYSLRLELNNRDLNQIENFKSFIGSNASIRETRKECSLIDINSIVFSNKLQSKGLIINKSKVYKKIEIDDALLIHYYRGMIDGDGWIVKHKSQYEIGLCSNHMIVLDKFHEFITNKLQIDKIGSKRKTRTVNQIIIGGNKNFMKLIDILGYNKYYSMPRKLLLINQAINDISTRVDGRTTRHQ